MQNKKGKKLLVITIIAVVILIILVGISIIYFTTDIFKGNKQLFFKYVSQIANDEDIYSQLTSYIEKKQNTPYTNEGKISLGISSSENQEQYENINNMDITFSGQVDSTNSNTEQNISINYSDSVTFPFIYKQIGKTIGIQTDFVNSKFVSMNLDSDNMMFGSINTAIQSLEKTENLNNVSFSDEEWKHISDTYFDVLNQQLQENNFSKIENANEIGYTLTLNQLEIKNIILKLLETLKSDQVTLSKINECLQQVSENSQSITTSDIDNLIQSIEQIRN